MPSSVQRTVLNFKSTVQIPKICKRNPSIDAYVKNKSYSGKLFEKH